MTAQNTTEAPAIAIGAMALATLSGDWRDRTVGLLREYLPDYDKLSQAQQQDIIDRATAIGEQSATESLTIVAAKALPSMGMRVKGVSRKGKVLTVQLDGPYSQANWNAWGAVEEMVAVQAAPDIYYGQKKPLYARPDQAAMDLGDKDETGDDVFEADAGDGQAERLQTEALGEAELGPEAIRNGDMIEAGIKPLDEEPPVEADAIEAGPAKKRGRRSAEERVAANIVATEQEPPAKRTRADKAKVDA